LSRVVLFVFVFFFFFDQYVFYSLRQSIGQKTGKVDACKKRHSESGFDHSNGKKRHNTDL